MLIVFLVFVWFRKSLIYFSGVSLQCFLDIWELSWIWTRYFILLANRRKKVCSALFCVSHCVILFSVGADFFVLHEWSKITFSRYVYLCEIFDAIFKEDAQNWLFDFYYENFTRFVLTEHSMKAESEFSDFSLFPDYPICVNLYLFIFL